MDKLPLEVRDHIAIVGGLNKRQAQIIGASPFARQQLFPHKFEFSRGYQKRKEIKNFGYDVKLREEDRVPSLHNLNRLQHVVYGPDFRVRRGGMAGYAQPFSEGRYAGPTLVVHPLSPSFTRPSSEVGESPLASQFYASTDDYDNDYESRQKYLQQIKKLGTLNDTRTRPSLVKRTTRVLETQLPDYFNQIRGRRPIGPRRSKSRRSKSKPRSRRSRRSKSKSRRRKKKIKKRGLFY